MDYMLKSFGYGTDPCPTVEEFKKLSLEEKDKMVCKIENIMKFYFIDQPEFDFAKLDEAKFGKFLGLKYVRLYDAYLHHTHRTEDIFHVAKKTPEELKAMLNDDKPIIKQFVSQMDEELKEKAVAKMEEYNKKNGIPAPEFKASSISILRAIKDEKAKEEFFLTVYESDYKAVEEFKAIKGKYEGLPKPCDFLNLEKDEKEKYFMQLFNEMKKNGEKMIELTEGDCRCHCEVTDTKYCKLFDAIAKVQKSEADMMPKEEFLKKDVCYQYKEVEKLLDKAQKLGIDTNLKYTIEESMNEQKKRDDNLSFFYDKYYVRLTRGH